MGNLKIYLVVFYFFYREKLKAEGEKSNVTVTLSNAEEEKRIEKKTKEERKEEIRRDKKRGG